MGRARIKWIEDDEATGELAGLYDSIRKSSQSGTMPDILRTMSLRPDFMMTIDAASRMHFTDGFLTRADQLRIIIPKLRKKGLTWKQVAQKTGASQRMAWQYGQKLHNTKAPPAPNLATPLAERVTVHPATG